MLLAASVLMVVSYNHNTFAAVINCEPTVKCIGLNEDDIMKGTKQGDAMRGGGGDDRIMGNDGGDEIIGESGDDTMTGGAGNEYIEGRQGSDRADGGSGNDVIVGDDEDGNNAADAGADVLLGGQDDDKLFHSQYIESHGGQPLASDGSKDKLDCGPGNDEAWININTDHDVVKNCETVHTEVE